MGPSLDFEIFGDFYNLQFAPMPNTMGRNHKKSTPMTSGNQFAAARCPPGSEHCWCCGFNVGCGLVRLLGTCQNCAVKGKIIRETKYDM